MSKSRELLDPICEWNRIVKEQGLYSDADLLKGVNEMKDELYEKRYFEDLSGYVLYETTTKEIKDIVIDSQKINVIGLDEFVKLKAKNLKLKRKTKKLYKEVEYWKNQAELLTKGLGYIRAEYSINGVAKAMATKTLDEYYQNEFDKKQKDEMKKGVGYWQGNQHD